MALFPGLIPCQSDPELSTGKPRGACGLSHRRWAPGGGVQCPVRGRLRPEPRNLCMCHAAWHGREINVIGWPSD